MAAAFRSVLFPAGTDASEPGPVEPAYFRDLHLTDIVDLVTRAWQSDQLTESFWTRLRDRRAIRYRQDVFRDLHEQRLIEPARQFTRRMRRVRALMEHAGKSYYHFERTRQWLDAARLYCDAVADLGRELHETTPRSEGLRGFAAVLDRLVRSAAFGTLDAEATAVLAGLATVRYHLRVQSGRVWVSRYEDSDPDFGAEVVATFDKFRQSDDVQFDFSQSSPGAMDHVQSAIVDRLARLYPAIFRALDRFAAEHAGFIDPTVDRFDREIKFYVAYLDHVASLQAIGLPFCYPVLADSGGAVVGQQVFDLALASLLASKGEVVVTNDFRLDPPERVLVVSGPNQGGKTTFARTVGQLHHLALIGCPVPGSAATVAIVDQIFTHFERAEAVEDLNGKLEDDLRRIRRILDAATSESLLIMNESFNSTTVDDQVVINTAVLSTIIRCDLVCVVVTFLDELSALDPATVSMVSSVDPDEPARRTFKIVRRPADGLAYAMALAEKHGLTYAAVKARLHR